MEKPKSPIHKGIPEWRVKVRPFARTITGINAPDLEADGFIEGNVFVCRFYGLPFRIEAVEVGTDSRGKYSWVEPGDIDMGDGFLIRVEEEWEEDGQHGCRICFMRSDVGEWHRIIQERGIDTSRFNVCMPPAQSVSVYFHCDGNVNGTGRIGT